MVQRHVLQDDGFVSLWSSLKALPFGERQLLQTGPPFGRSLGSVCVCSGLASPDCSWCSGLLQPAQGQYIHNMPEKPAKHA